MHTATRMDCARAHVGGPERFLVLALASGIAGLTITYPTITLGNATVGEWAGRFEIRPSRLAVTDTLPPASVSAKFHDAALVTARHATATASGPAAQRAEGAAASVSLASSPSPIPNSRGYAPADKSLLAERVVPLAPLDAVRIALPPAASELSTAGALAPQATLNSVAAARPAPAPGSQSLADSSPPQSSTVSAPATAGVRSSALLSAPKEVQEFDLATLGRSKSLSLDLARTAARAIATAKPAARTGDLSKASKVADRVVGDHILHVAGLSLEGVPSGDLSVRIGMGGDLSLKLADLLQPVQDQMAPEAFQRLANSSAASEYVSFAQLRAAGFDIRYDAGSDRLMVSAQP